MSRLIPHSSKTIHGFASLTLNLSYDVPPSRNHPTTPYQSPHLHQRHKAPKNTQQRQQNSRRRSWSHQNPEKCSTSLLKMKILVSARPRLPQSDLLVLVFFKRTRPNLDATHLRPRGHQNPKKCSTSLLKMEITHLLRGRW